MMRYFRKTRVQRRIDDIKFIMNWVLLAFCILIVLWVAISYFQVMCHNINVNEHFQYPMWNFFEMLRSLV